MGEARGRGQRAGLSRAAVLAAARELVAERGLAGLSMRALAARLGVAPNALYSHVSSKTALVDAVLDDLLGQVAEPAPGDDPLAGLRALLLSTYRALLAAPDLVPLYLARQGARGPNAQRLGAAMTSLLDGVGVRGDAARDAVRVLVVHTIGFAAMATGPTVEPGQERPLADDAVLDAFDTGLRWLLAGIRAQTCQG